ncbi:hypothetical protein, partial [Alteromonas sp. 14N.309.X.WAT.G.H12]|uniref:hypothetical protein n=1 Tax=Alteromonas sp. 14N.309.X.WAT.G.H12 TaxID=3120824 RepID=UPI002FD67BD3
ADRYYDNIASNNIDAVSVNYTNKSVYADTDNPLFSLGTSAAAFNGEIPFNNPLYYLEAMYKAANTRPEEQAPVFKTYKDSDATMGAF